MAEWETVDEQKAVDGSPRTLTERMRVRGGHLYRTLAFGWGKEGLGRPPAVALAYVGLWQPAPPEDAEQPAAPAPSPTGHC